MRGPFSEDWIESMNEAISDSIARGDKYQYESLIQMVLDQKILTEEEVKIHTLRGMLRPMKGENDE